MTASHAPCGGCGRRVLRSGKPSAFIDGVSRPFHVACWTSKIEGKALPPKNLNKAYTATRKPNNAD